MPIREESFRIGSGRYLQGCGAIAKLPDEILRLGKAPLIVGGKTALEKTQTKIESSLVGKIAKYKIITYTGACYEERAMELASLAREEGYDVIVGDGGGVICDFSKLIAYHCSYNNLC